MNATTDNNNTTEQTHNEDPQPLNLTIRVPGKKYRPYRPRRDPARMTASLAWYYRNREEVLEKVEERTKTNKKEMTDEERERRREYEREYLRRRREEEERIGNAKGITLKEIATRQYRKKNPVPKNARTVIVGDYITLEEACRYALINLGINTVKREEKRRYYRERYQKKKEEKKEQQPEPESFEI